jgi:hypothetical protein
MMPTTPYALLRIKVNGGAPQTGRVEVLPGDTIQLDAESYDGWTSPVARWEFYSFPDTWTGPGGGWSSETVAQPDGTDATVYYWLGNSQPPSFTAPTITDWGKYLPRLIVNDGYKGGAPSTDVVDESTMMEIVSANGVRDLAWREGKQGGQEKKWTRDHQENLRTIDTSLTSLSALTPYGSTPTTVQSSTGSAGASANYARGDHSHQLTFTTLNSILGAASAPITVNGQTLTSGGFIGPTLQLVDGVAGSVAYGSVAAGTGADLTIAAQGGVTAGGMLLLSGGSSATTPGVLRLRTYPASGVSAAIEFYSNATEYLSITNDGAETFLDSPTTITARTDITTTIAPALQAGSAAAMTAPLKFAKQYTTNDASTVGVIGYELAQNTVAFISVIAVGLSSTSGDASVFHVRTGAKRLLAGAALVGANDVFAGEDNAATNASITVAGNNVFANVVGLVGENIDWFVTMEVTLITP